MNISFNPLISFKGKNLERAYDSVYGDTINQYMCPPIAPCHQVPLAPFNIAQLLESDRSLKQISNTHRLITGNQDLQQAFEQGTDGLKNREVKRALRSVSGILGDLEPGDITPEVKKEFNEALDSFKKNS